MNTGPIQNLSEISKLAHVARHENDDHAEYDKKKQKKHKHQNEDQTPNEDVEDLMDHSHEDANQPDELTILPLVKEERDGEINLDVLI